MGGGRRYFLPNTTTDPEKNTVDKNQRQDGRDLTVVRVVGVGSRCVQGAFHEKLLVR